MLVSVLEYSFCILEHVCMHVMHMDVFRVRMQYSQTRTATSIRMHMYMHKTKSNQG